MIWQLGQGYTRDEIHEALGGGTQFFLPSKDGVVVAACLRPDLNPDAPLVVLPGHGPDRERAADWLSAHPEQVFPVFIKRGINDWEYRGRYRCERWSDDPDEIQRRTPADRPDPVYRVLFLELVQ
jgi:hypothetical protein